MRLRLWSLLCLLALFSCQKPEEPPKVVTTPVQRDAVTYLPDAFPELDKAPGVLYDEHIGYHIRLEEKTWSRTWTPGEVYIPAQTFPFTIKSSWYDEPDVFTGWTAGEILYVLLKDVRIPDFGADFDFGNCDATARLKIALAEDAPYRKVTLSDLDIDFPESFRVEIEGEGYGSIPELEVTREGAVVNMHLSSIFQPERFRDAQGRRCMSFETRFITCVTASPEDAVGSVATPPAGLTFRCSLEFDRIDFTQCSLLLAEPLTLPADELVWDPAPLPSYFTGGNADVVLDYPRIRMEYRSDVPFAPTLDATVRNDGAEASFYVPGSGAVMVMPRGDGVYREDAHNEEAPGMENLFRSPFPDGCIRPSLVLRPPVATESFLFTPGKEYRMSAKAEWIIPFYVKGQLDVEDFATPPIFLESENLGAEPGCRHEVSQIVGANFPFEVMVTPVLEIEGEGTQYLEPFRLEAFADRRKLFISFAPARTPWSATVRYVVKPLRTTGDFLFKWPCVSVTETIFSANVEKVTK